MYKTIILPVVLYGCESWSLTLRKEYRDGVFDNRVPRRTFGPNKDEGRGGWRKLHNEELRDLYFSPRMRWAGACSTNGGEEERRRERDQ
jgi:hypothetical protein